MIIDELFRADDCKFDDSFLKMNTNFYKSVFDFSYDKNSIKFKYTYCMKMRKDAEAGKTYCQFKIVVLPESLSSSVRYNIALKGKKKMEDITVVDVFDYCIIGSVAISEEVWNTDDASMRNVVLNAYSNVYQKFDNILEKFLDEKVDGHNTGWDILKAAL